MGRVLAVVGAVLVLCIGGLALAVFLTRDEDQIAIDNLLSERFTRAVALADQRGGVVDLRALAPFAWDRVLIARRGTPRAAISRRIGFEFKGIVVGIDAGDLLIFLKGSEVARFADYRGEGRFAGISRPLAMLPRRRAVFVVRDLVIRPRAAAGAG